MFQPTVLSTPGSWSAPGAMLWPPSFSHCEARRLFRVGEVASARSLPSLSGFLG